MATMLSTIANKGRYIKPHLVKQIIGKDETITIDKQEKEQVISEETAQNVLSMMESVVSEGTGKNAKVEGYRIGGKTGVAPIENPQVVVLVTLYDPKGEGGHSGGAVAAPVAGKIFKEVLEYLEIPKNNIEK